MEIFREIHSGLPQEGPGNDESTQRALGLVPNLPAVPKILDVGCGPGRQTLALASRTDGKITAVDTHQPFLEELKKRSRAAGLSDRIFTRNCSMAEMNFAEHSFDLIWSEGAIYIMGFQDGLENWRRFLKPRGCLAATEVAWLVADPPAEILKFWEEAYPAITTIAQNRRIIKDAGYALQGDFTLPESAWWDGYYRPLEKRLAQLRIKHADNQAALDYLESERQEIDLFRKYSEVYGYVFYVMQLRA